MNKAIEKYNKFLNNIKDCNPTLVETVQKGFAEIFESTEDVVEKIKNKYPTTKPKQLSPEEEIEKELELSGEISPETPENDIFAEKTPEIDKKI